MVGKRYVLHQPASGLEKLFVGILLVIFGGIVLHAPLSVGLGTLFPDFALVIKSWKEVLIVVAAVLALLILRRKKQTDILKEPLMIGIGIYLAFHVFSILLFDGEADSVLAGLAIDVRYILFFALTFIAVRLYPSYKKVFIKVAVAGALVAMTFALLQVFVLPADILKYIGYNVNTIVPYLTVDQNQDFIRINSTLRGPNPLGAYAGIVLSLLLAFWLRGRHELYKRPMFIVTLLFIGGGHCALGKLLTECVDWCDRRYRYYIGGDSPEEIGQTGMDYRSNRPLCTYRRHLHHARQYVRFECYFAREPK